jgi:DNA-directed RNA polymerase specialized sigma24 family protein
MTRGQDVDAEFTAFVTSNWPRLVRSAHLLTGDWHRAHDLVQSAMERCYPRWRSIRARCRRRWTRRRPARGPRTGAASSP